MRKKTHWYERYQKFNQQIQQIKGVIKSQHTKFQICLFTFFSFKVKDGIWGIAFNGPLRILICRWKTTILVEKRTVIFEKKNQFQLKSKEVWPAMRSSCGKSTDISRKWVIGTIMKLMNILSSIIAFESRCIFRLFSIKNVSSLIRSTYIFIKIKRRLQWQWANEATAMHTTASSATSTLDQKQQYCIAKMTATSIQLWNTEFKY